MLLFMLVLCILFFFPLSLTLQSLSSSFACVQTQKKRVAEEEAASKKIGLGIRLLPPSAEDAATAASVKFAHKFDRNRRDKRAIIYSGSIFSESSGSSKRSELESKRRKINASAASKLLVGGFKPSSWSETAASSKKQRRI